MAITKDDILEALGLETGSNDNWIAPALIGFGVGALLGGTMALMFAPKSGPELREDLMERGRTMVEKGRERVQRLSENVNVGTNKPEDRVIT
jgi:gas vesicle protein